MEHANFDQGAEGPDLSQRSSRRLVKEYLEVAGHCSLASLVDALQSLRTSIPESAEAEVTLIVDDDFGERILITYLRGLKDEEEALETKYNVPVAAIPTLPITPREVHYDEHNPLLWGGGWHAQQVGM